MNASKSSEVCEQNTNSGQQIVSSGSQKDDNSGSTEEVPHCDVRCSSQQRSKVPGLQRNIKVLESELLKFIAEHGQEGFMPMRKQLRLHGRVDIEKAITRMGGFRKIATILNLSLAYKHRKPKGYWDNLENLQEEVVCKNSNLVYYNALCFSYLKYFHFLLHFVPLSPLVYLLEEMPLFNHNDTISSKRHL